MLCLWRSKAALTGANGRRGRKKYACAVPRPWPNTGNVLQQEISFWQYVQYLFFSQWEKLKTYANQNGISIIGDIPIYVAMDSADVWVEGDLFQLDESRRPTAVAGVPPDMFSATGQLWGNPLYDWQAMERDGFAWWKARMSSSAALYDLIRIDHFIGVVNYYAIPAGENTAMNGQWMPGPGEKLLDAITPVLKGKKIIAEDLGVVTPEVRRLLKKSGYPGMKLMEFAFDSDSSNENLPCHFEKNMVIYGGTHDNETLAGFFGPGQNRQMLRFARRYLNVPQNVQIPLGADPVRLCQLCGHGGYSRCRIFWGWITRRASTRPLLWAEIGAGGWSKGS